jgi:gamma-glutamyltranspeptidase/glutathione hydrolase
MRARIASVLLLTVSLMARQPEHAKHAMVVTQEPLAADVGLRVLQAGGNAIDAAVAVGFALAVTYPYAGNIGGGGFLLAHFADGRATFIDFREKAPLAATRNMYLDSKGNVTEDTLVGWRAAGVPGTVRGLELAHQKYGRKPWAELVNPAIQLAREGYAVSYSFDSSLRNDEATKLLSRFPDSKRVFLSAHYGDKFVQPELAATLKRIRDRGASDFYEGETAQKLAAAMAAHGGLITLADLKAYQAEESAPLHGKYHGDEILTSPPPSAGGVGLLQMLGMLEGSGYEKTGAGSAASIHYVAEVMRRSYADRSEYFGDPDFYQVPVSKLLDPKYIAGRRSSIDPLHATPSDQIRPGISVREGTETTHFNIVDSEGNAVAVTYTLNNGYGSGVTVPGLGFLLNDEMDDFAAKPGTENLFHLIQGENNAIQPGRRPVSSMTPTIVLRDGKFFLMLGAPGGSRIINGVLQVLLNVVDFHMNVQDAVDWPRFHHQWMPDVLYVEKGISPDTVRILRGMGHKVAPLEGSVVARVEAILSDGGWLQGGSDERGNGKAEGY